MHIRKETEDDRRLLEAAQDVLGMKGEIDLNETFSQSSFAFQGYIPFKAFVDQARTKVLVDFLKKYEQETALAALQLIYMNDLINMEKAEEIGAFINENHTLEERFRRLKLERKQVPVGQDMNLYVRMNNLLRNNPAELKVSYGYQDEKKIMTYLASGMTADTVDSMPFAADIEDQRSLERAIQASMIDLNPNYFKRS